MKIHIDKIDRLSIISTTELERAYMRRLSDFKLSVYFGHDGSGDAISVYIERTPNNEESRKTASNNRESKLPCPHLDNVGGCCLIVGHKKCNCVNVTRQLSAAR